MARDAPSPLDPVVKKCVQGFDEDRKHHDRFVDQADRLYRSYRGLLESRSKAAEWTNKLHPPFNAQVIETMVAGLMDPNPKWTLRATAQQQPPNISAALREGARELELLLGSQRRDSWTLKDQRTHRLQALVTRLTAVKTYWTTDIRQTPRWESYEETVYDDFGYPLGVVPKQRKTTSLDTVRDDAAMEVVDVRDLIWHEAAVSLERSPRVTHRLWMTFAELKALEKTSDNPNGVYENVDALKESRNFGPEIANRERDLFETDRTKDQIEVLECWIDGGRRVVTIGNRKVLLADRPNPFWHGRYPFVVCNGMPDLFRIPGISEVELIMELQEMLWTLQNQQLDNLQLLNNAIILIASDVDDPDAFDFAPGEKWLVDRVDQVQFNRPEPITAELASGTIDRLKADLQAISGGMPWLSGDNRQANTGGTATEASILTNLAQRRVAVKKQFFLEADAQAGDLFIQLNEQFLTKPRYLQIVGADGEAGWQLIHPESFRDYRFRVQLDALEESLERPARRAEAQAKLQNALQAAEYFAAIPGQPGLNLKAFMDDYLDAYGITDKERYYSQLAPTQQIGGPQQQGDQQQASPLGVTSPTATDANSPSNAFSQSPVAALQRMGATLGGPNNIPQ